MDARAINALLEEYYESVWPALVKRMPKAKGLELPQLIAASPDYAHATNKLMIIDRQTGKWTTGIGQKIHEVTVRELMTAHRQFNNAEFDTETAKIGFWKRSYLLQDMVNPGIDRHGFLYSTLVKAAQNGGQPTPEIADAISDFPLLRKEIELTQPTAAVFFVGSDPFYDKILTKTFPNIVTEPVPGYNADSLVMLKHPDLPALSFRAAHTAGMGKRVEAIVTTIARTILKG